jgi:hypothetical protein
MGMDPRSLGIAASCVVLAQRLDATTGAASAALAARELRISLTALAAPAPVDRELADLFRELGLFAGPIVTGRLIA